MIQRKKSSQSKANEGQGVVAGASQKRKLEQRPSSLRVWILASRPHTLTASIAPVLVGLALVRHYVASSVSKLSTDDNNTMNVDDSSATVIAALFGSFACLIQLGTNLHNDYADFVKGADTEKRVGQARATQKGWLTPFQTAFGSTFCLVLATILGILLTKMCRGVSSVGDDILGIDPYMLFVTISSVFNAVAYTGGPYPLGYIGLGNLSIGYSGLGDVFVFLYFGLVATVTVPYVYLASTTLSNATGFEKVVEIFRSPLFLKSLMVALPVGFLGTAIIAVNNLRDRKTDVFAGKRTVAVRFGETFTRMEYMILVKGSYLFLIPLSRFLVGDDSNYRRVWLYLPLLSYPLARGQLKAMGMVGGKDGAALNPYVGGTARVQLLYCILLIVGLKMSNL